MKRIALALLLVALASGARAQSNPGLIFGQVPTPAQWNSYFAAKMDYSGQPACLTSGCTFTGPVSAPAIVSTGTPPTNSGSCAITAQAGGNTAGVFTASGACAAGTYIFTFASTAPTGWACAASDRTTTTDTVQQTASTTTTATFKATTANSDVVSFQCAAY